MYSSTITLNMHKYENKYPGTQITNVLAYDYFKMYSSMSTITLEYNHDYFHDYFNEYPVSNIKATFMESLGVNLFLLLCHYIVF